MMYSTATIISAAWISSVTTQFAKLVVHEGNLSSCTPNAEDNSTTLAKSSLDVVHPDTICLLYTSPSPRD